MKNEAMKTVVDAFILERINDCGSRPNESLSDAIEQLSVCAPLDYRAVVHNQDNIGASC